MERKQTPCQGFNRKTLSLRITLLLQFGSRLAYEFRLQKYLVDDNINCVDLSFLSSLLKPSEESRRIFRKKKNVIKGVLPFETIRIDDGFFFLLSYRPRVSRITMRTQYNSIEQFVDPPNQSLHIFISRSDDRVDRSTIDIYTYIDLHTIRYR